MEKLTTEQVLRVLSATCDMAAAELEACTQSGPTEKKRKPKFAGRLKSPIRIASPAQIEKLAAVQVAAWARELVDFDLTPMSLADRREHTENLVAALETRNRNHILQQRIEKLELLMDAYEIKGVAGLAKLTQLAIVLAESYVPGFAVKYATARGPGARRKWTPELQAVLAAEVKKLRKDGKTVTDSVDEIARRASFSDVRGRSGKISRQRFYDAARSENARSIPLLVDFLKNDTDWEAFLLRV